jgi:GNAT superfamily N-acetyltransferase
MTDPVSLSLDQFAGAWRVLCAGASGYREERGDGVDYVFSGLDIAFFNLALMTAHGISPEALTTLANGACAWAAEKDVPWMLVVTHERLDAGADAAAVLHGSELAPMMTLTGMVATQLSPSTRRAEGLELTVPQDSAGYAAIGDINGAAYDMPLDASKPLLGRPAFWKDHFTVVGLVDGAPAATASVLMVDGMRYVALVATQPGHQRKGFADAAMRGVLENASRVYGERTTVLHATDAGLPVYTRMGYETISTHTLFMEKKFLAGH